MFAQQHDVPPVGAEQHVERVAGQRHGANRTFEEDIGQHARQERARHTKPVSLVEQITGECRGRGIAHDRHEAQQKLHAEPDAGARHHERRVEHGRQHVEPVERRTA